MLLFYIWLFSLPEYCYLKNLKHCLLYLFVPFIYLFVFILQNDPVDHSLFRQFEDCFNESKQSSKLWDLIKQFEAFRYLFIIKKLYC